MADIAPELLKKIQDDFQKHIDEDDFIAELTQMLEMGKAKHPEAYQYAERIGLALSDAYQKNLYAGLLPEGRLWYNIANRVIPPTMQDNYNIVEQYVNSVQSTLNQTAGLGLKPITPKLNVSRIEGIVNRVSNAEVFEDVAWVLNAPIINFSQNIVDESIKANVDFHGKAGMQPKIIRTYFCGNE